MLSVFRGCAAGTKVNRHDCAVLKIRFCCIWILSPADEMVTSMRESTLAQRSFRIRTGIADALVRYVSGAAVDIEPNCVGVLMNFTAIHMDIAVKRI